MGNTNAGEQPSDHRHLLKGFPVIVELSIAWGEMDSYRHVNNVVYFRYFENARLEYFRRLDWFAFEKASGIGPILASTQARFRKPLTYPDRISVGARVSNLSEDRFTMKHLVISQGQKIVAAEGQGTIVTFHYGREEKVHIPDELRQRVAKLEESCQSPCSFKIS